MEPIKFYKEKNKLWELTTVTNIILYILTGLQRSESI